jgi:biofilm protein TabA
MISDALGNWKQYFAGPVWQKAFEFLEGLSADSAEGEFELDGQRLFARVVSYETFNPEMGEIEAHRNYIDVQMALDNAEGIAWTRQPGLSVKTPYNPDNDAELYDAPGSPSSQVNLYPGTFAVFFPEDAHMPQLTVGDKPQTVKKVVVKVARELLESASV